MRVSEEELASAQEQVKFDDGYRIGWAEAEAETLRAAGKWLLCNGFLVIDCFDVEDMLTGKKPWEKKP